MASRASIELARQAAMEPVELPAPGVQSMSTGEAAARAHVDRDPDAGAVHRNRLVPIEHQGPTTGPDIRPPGVDRVAFARDVGHERPWLGEDVVTPLGTHVEQRGAVQVQPDQGLEAPFTTRKNTFRVPPQPADTGLVYGE